MKLSILIIGFSVITQIVSAQQSTVIDSSIYKDPYQFYTKKHSTNKTIGWVIASAGLVLFGIGAAQPVPHYYIDNNPALGFPKQKGNGLRIAGGILGLASIPFFVSAHIYKRKATIALKGESASIFHNPYLYSLMYPAIAVKVQF